jgi:lysophospholipase L1-like esterase
MNSMNDDCYASEDAWFAAVPDSYRSLPGHAFVERNRKLPDVLLIGDSISMSYTVDVRSRLAGAANVFRAPDNCRSTRQISANIETYLGEVTWNVIHFNAGIHDLTWMDADGEVTEIGVGDRQVPLEAYRRNLEQIVERLSQTGAKLIWATTTPVQQGTPLRDPDDAIAYNAAAAEIMTRHKIAIDDLFALAEPRLTELQRPQNVHFTESGAEVLAVAVAECIRTALPVASTTPQ